VRSIHVPSPTFYLHLFWKFHDDSEEKLSYNVNKRNNVC